VLKLFYELGYRYWRMPWEGGPRSELVELVRSGRLEPCRALERANAVFLAEHRFEVTRCREWLVNVAVDLRRLCPIGG
jgi:hypothetical protein